MLRSLTLFYYISENMSGALSFVGLQCLDSKWRLEEEKKLGFIYSHIHPRLGHSINGFSSTNIAE